MRVRSKLFIFGVFILSSCALASRESHSLSEKIPSISKPVLLRGMVVTQREMLDRLFHHEREGRPDSAEFSALSVVYCDLIDRGVVEKAYSHCNSRTGDAAKTRACSARFYYQLTRLSSIHSDCQRCLDRLVACLAEPEVISMDRAEP